MSNVIIIINGHAGSGKDTFVEESVKFFNNTNTIKVNNVSSIDPIKNLLNHIGIDVKSKTYEDRDLLSKLGDYMQLHYNAKIVHCIDSISNYVAIRGTSNITFVHIREPKMIDLFKSTVQNSFFEPIIKTLLIKRDNHENELEMGVDDYNYDDVVYNNGSLPDLQRTIIAYFNNAFEQGLKL